jgi:hypothetical protein
MKTATRKDWEIKRMPKQRTELVLDRTFSPGEMDLIKRGFIPKAMEQKWFIFFERNRLHVHRSWTGVCVYVVQFEKKACDYVISRVEANRHPKQWSETDDVYDAKLLSWLIDGALLGRERPFPQKAGESSNEDEDAVAAEDGLAVEEPKTRIGPPRNADLLTAEEKATEPGIGMLMAATRLGLTYLADISTMEKLLRDHAKEAVTILEHCQHNALAESELYKRVEEVTQRLAKVLRGEDPRYMATAWFTDPNQLRQVLYDQHYSYFGDNPELSGWQGDPIREQVSYFLETVVQILAEAAETTPKEEILQQFNEHVRWHVARFLNIPDSLYQYPPQEPDVQPEDSAEATTPHT